MTASTRIDYTNKRLNTRADGGRIERCPKCGRKGRMVRMRNPTSGGRPRPPFWTCGHVADLVTSGGLRWLSVRDHCSGPIIDGVDAVRQPKEES